MGRRLRDAARRAGPGADHRALAGEGVSAAPLTTMTYEVTGRIARITFDRPDKGNAIVIFHALTGDQF
ncbi:MAG TPA: hypothetical protein PK871_14950, partial [Mycobacterium sp.]|nr:hypothetical protein [Mycobacterium sp.]